MYLKRLDAILAWLAATFPTMVITEDLCAIENQNARQLKNGVLTVLMGPAHSFSNALHGQATLGKQVVQVVIQQRLSDGTKGSAVTRAELALFDQIRKLQNDPNLPPEASGLVIRDIINSQQSKVPDLEILATFEVQDL